MTQVLILGLWELILPLLAGGMYRKIIPKEWGTIWRVLFCWVMGTLSFFALLQLLAVPEILRWRTLYELQEYWTAAAAAAAFAGTACILTGIFKELRSRGIHRGEASGKESSGSRGKTRKGRGIKNAGGSADAVAKAGLFKDPVAVALTILALVLLGTMIVLSFVLTYRDGDDAFYIATATTAAASGNMYRGVAYTGSSGLLNLRYCMAPFPMLLSILSRLSGMSVATVAHSGFPCVMMAGTFALYALLGKSLFGEDRRSLSVYLVFVQILIFFGNYSTQSPENFLVARSRQGKAALANLVLPLLFFLLLLFFREISERKRDGKRALLFAFTFVTATLAAGLCSMLSAALVSLLLGAAVLCGILCFKTWRHLPVLILATLPPLFYGVLYFVLASTGNYM
jgi:hypothetical protein